MISPEERGWGFAIGEWVAGFIHPSVETFASVSTLLYAWPCYGGQA